MILLCRGCKGLAVLGEHQDVTTALTVLTCPRCGDVMAEGEVVFDDASQ